MTLLEKAKAACGGRGRPQMGAIGTDEELQLAVAFLNGEVSYGGAAKALGMAGGSTAGVHLLSVLRRAMKDGRAHLMVLR